MYLTQSVNVNGGSWLMNGERPTVANPPGVISNSLTWETVQSLNVGADLAMLDNRLTANFDYFIRNTLNMSVSTLYRKSKANMGTAPIELIHQSRISAARDLLASGAYTIQEISEKVGYEDVLTLRKHFYRKFGIMPSQYRKNNAEPA